MAIQAMKRWHKKKLDEGYKRLPTGLMPPDVAAALDNLLESEYASSKTQVVCRALMEANNRLIKTEQSCISGSLN